MIHLNITEDAEKFSKKTEFVQINDPQFASDNDRKILELTRQKRIGKNSLQCGAGAKRISELQRTELKSAGNTSLANGRGWLHF